MASEAELIKTSLMERSTKNGSLVEDSQGTDISEQESDSDKPAERGSFDNPFEFVLTCLGLAVGLGNIWRFPTRAYENGGSAFLLPYIACAVCFGLPVVYLEFLAGQYGGVSPPIIFRRIRPILEGVGWMGPVVSATVAVYYIVIVSWICIYLFNIFRGHLNIWNTCDNEWNDKSTCIDLLAQKICREDSDVGNSSSIKMVYINGTCQPAENLANVTLLSATEQYFKSYIIQPSKGLFDINRVNYPILIAMLFCWFLTALMILKGVKVIGKIAYVTVVLPYVIVIVLFFRGITLDGAYDGLYFYLGKPDFSKVFTGKIWADALIQLCFSLSVGQGGLMSLASYNKNKTDCFTAALIVIIGDTIMSLLGGAAVFSTLGFLAKQRGVGVPDVVESGLCLTFVVYPEAMTQMPLPWLWGFLFFFMLFLLGISTEMALVEVFCTCLYDRVPKLRKKKARVVLTWCTILCLCGLMFSTDSGFYWFTLFDEYSSGFAAVCTSTFEILVIAYIYKASNFRKDIEDMLGKAKNSVTAAIGPLSPYFTWNWRVISPALGLVLIAFSFMRDYPFKGNPKAYPPFFDIFGWTLSLFPPFMIPLFAVINYIQFRKNFIPTSALFVIQKQHPSFYRIVGEMEESKQDALKAILPDCEPWTLPKPPWELTESLKSITEAEASPAQTPSRTPKDPSDFSTIAL